MGSYLRIGDHQGEYHERIQSRHGRPDLQLPVLCRTSARAVNQERKREMGMGETAGSHSISTQLNVTIVNTAHDVAVLAADAVAETLASDPAAPISLPTGSTPLGMYQEILRRVAAGTMDISRMNLFLLDEYLGQTKDDEASLTHWLERVFLVPGNLSENVHYIPSADPAPDVAAARYEADLAALGGLKLAILGLGPNGHIAFNEPGSAADSRTRVVDLTPESRNQSADYFDGREEIPAQAMTMGVGTLLEAERIILIVTGANKAGILHRALEGAISAEIPASWLRLVTEKLEVIVDKAAAAELHQ
jgi:glucosamine-6-phosphate deaminase